MQNPNKKPEAPKPDVAPPSQKLRPLPPKPDFRNGDAWADQAMDTATEAEKKLGLIGQQLEIVKHYSDYCNDAMLALGRIITAIDEVRVELRGIKARRRDG
jgi:hypothetical protein